LFPVLPAGLAGTVLLAASLAGLAPAAAQTLNRVPHDIEAGDYTLRFLEDPDIGFVDTLQVLRGGEVVFETLFEAFVHMVDEPPGSPDGVLPLGLDVDATGDGRPDFVLQSYSGGAHCCFYTQVIEREPELALLAEFDGSDSPVSLEQRDADPALEVVLYDWSFAYWKAPFSESPAPLVILDLQEGVYLGAVELMRQPAPPPAEIASLAAEAQAAMRTSNGPTSALWGPMLDLIYSGNGEAAFQLFDQGWAPGVPGRNAFLVQFGAQLSLSPYWETVTQLNGWTTDF
jgi:hypothetical protein